MSKSIKLKNNNYCDSVVHNKLSLKTILDTINSSVTNYVLNSVTATDTTDAKTWSFGGGLLTVTRLK